VASVAARALGLNNRFNLFIISPYRHVVFGFSRCFNPNAPDCTRADSVNHHGDNPGLRAGGT
jgi:hypothetical protein